MPISSAIVSCSKRFSELLYFLFSRRVLAFSFPFTHRVPLYCENEKLRLCVWIALNVFIECLSTRPRRMRKKKRKKWAATTIFNDYRTHNNNRLRDRPFVPKSERMWREKQLFFISTTENGEMSSSDSSRKASVSVASSASRINHRKK